MDDLIDRLRATLGEEGVLTGQAVAARQTGYFDPTPMQAKAILRPASTAEVAAALRLCFAAGQTVVPQGGMTNLVGNTLTGPQDVVLSLERMNAIEEIDPAGATMTAQAGATLQQVQEAASEAGLFFAVDLTTRGSVTVGGAVANNAGGTRVIRYGMIRDQVLGLEAVLADGSVLTSLNKMLKNNSGYDLKQLFIGSEGTLGVVTRAVLRLWPKPAGYATALVSMQDFEQACKLLRLARQEMPGELVSFEVMWKDFYELTTTPPAVSKPPIPHGAALYTLLELLEIERGQYHQQLQSLLNQAFDQGLFSEAVVAQNSQQRAALWRIREDSELIEAQYEPAFSFDVSLPIGDMEGYANDLRAKLAEAFGNVKLWVYGHVGDGNLHLGVWGEKVQEEDRTRIEELVYQPLARIGGSISAEHGIGLERKAYLHYSRTPAEVAAMRRIKKALDPKNILNPGKIFDME